MEQKGKIKEEFIKAKDISEEKTKVKQEYEKRVIQESTKDEKEIKEIIGIKLPWWIGYTLLVIIIAVSIFFIYKLYNRKFTNETVEKVDNFLFIISCNKDEISLGEIIKLDIKKYDENVILQSSNPEVISVKNDCVIGVAEGETTILAIHGEEKSNEILLKCIVKLEDIILNKANTEILIGKEEKLKASLVPENATYKDVIWESSNESIATVGNGNIKGIKEGKVTITVSDLEKTKSASCVVTVKPIEVKSVSLDDENVKIGVGQTYILRNTISPSNATYKNVTWKSSNNGVITVNNGNITAIAEGESTVMVTTKNGKTASCTFKVTQSAPKNAVKYATDSFNIRTGPGTSYKLLGSVSKNDEIEILKEESNWTKLRLNNGIVGYTISKAYSSTKAYYIEGVPYINQFNLGYPTGCEAVSATMIAQYSGYNVSAGTIIANTTTDTLGKRQEIITKEIPTEVLNETTGEMETKNITQEETVWVGGNPFQVFVGHPTIGLSQGSYGCFAAPITAALNSSGVSCSNISGCSVETLYGYIKEGKPVVVWCKKNAGDLTEGITWKYPDGTGEFVELVGEHCAVLIGYDGEYVYLNDPSAGKGVKQPKWKFESNWYKLYSQALIIN